MLIKQLRYSGEKIDTLSVIFINDKSFCYVIEDGFKEVKVKGETRIPEGQYLLKINKTETPLTLKHRQTYGSWFKYHIQIMNVPNFENVYIHAGNTAKDTDGCLCLGYKTNINTNSFGFIQDSVKAVKDFYSVVYPILEAGNEPVHLRIIDESFIKKL